MEDSIVIDATDLVLGRMASVVAKHLLNGERVTIINAEKAVVTGNPRFIKEKYKKFLQIRTITAPWKGPIHYRRPDRLVRRTIRGMLPWKKARGREAYKRLRVYIGIPEFLSGVNAQTIPDAHISGKVNAKFVRVEDISREVGWSMRR
ncbi:MAG: 50S ribosomal protein L13 [Candidatus Jordarchaeales archaeon]|nr:50S ribosomal protein L13 [Candidatus Jordarchaeia archaeon]